MPRYCRGIRFGLSFILNAIQSILRICLAGSGRYQLLGLGPGQTEQLFEERSCGPELLAASLEDAGRDALCMRLARNPKLRMRTKPSDVPLAGRLIAAGRGGNHTTTNGSLFRRSNLLDYLEQARRRVAQLVRALP